MRFADRVVFIKKGKMEYDRETGDYIEAGETHESRMANISEMGDEYLSFAYGDSGISRRGLTVRVKQAPLSDFDEVKVVGGRFKSDKTYKDIDSRSYWGKRTFKLEEVK